MTLADFELLEYIAAEYAFGSNMATRTYVGASVMSTTFSYLFAWINIKQLQIGQ